MGMIRKAPSHLLLVGTAYHFRYVIPARFRRLMSGEIRLSLQTRSIRTARSRAARLASEAALILSQIEEGSLIMTKDEIRAKLADILEEALEASDAKRLEQPGPNPFKAEEFHKTVALCSRLSMADGRLAESSPERLREMVESWGMRDVSDDLLLFRRRNCRN